MARTGERKKESRFVQPVPETGRLRAYRLNSTFFLHFTSLHFTSYLLTFSLTYLLTYFLTFCMTYWKLAAHMAKLPIHHWIQRVLHWQPVGPRRLGRPKHRWDSKLEMYCRYQILGRGEDTAQDFEVWKQQLNGFLDFCSQ